MFEMKYIYIVLYINEESNLINLIFVFFFGIISLNLFINI